MQDCDISSATGSGVGSEGGQLALIRCSVHNCKRHGVAMFGDLEGSEGALRDTPIQNHAAASAGCEPSCLCRCIVNPSIAGQQPCPLAAWTFHLVCMAEEAEIPAG